MKTVEEFVRMQKLQEAQAECLRAKMAAAENEKRHLEHPFYKRVDEVTDEIKREQILKGAVKYSEPFNPASWTNKELVTHLLQELRDGQVYGVGLLERLEEQDQALEKMTHVTIENCDLRKEIDKLKWRIKTTEIESKSANLAYNDLLRNYKELNKLYNMDAVKIREFTRFIVENFPDAGNAGDYAIDVAMDLLKKL